MKLPRIFPLVLALLSLSIASGQTEVEQKYPRDGPSLTRWQHSNGGDTVTHATDTLPPTHLPSDSGNQQYIEGEISMDKNGAQTWLAIEDGEDNFWNCPRFGASNGTPCGSGTTQGPQDDIGRVCGASVSVASPF